MEALAGLSVVFAILAVVVAVLWIALPFAIFGTKPLLRELVQEIRWANETLAKIAAERQRPPS